MAKTATDIITRALTLIDEQLTEFATAATTEMSLTDIAADILPEVCRNLVKDLPYELKRYLAASATLSEETLNGSQVESGVKRKVAFVAPTDFWELVAIRLTVWSDPVTSYILKDSIEYAKQNNPFTRAGKHNPVVALSIAGGTSASRIECFSVHNTDAHTVALFQYVSFDNIPNDIVGVGSITWPDELFNLVSKALASELMLIKERVKQGALIGGEGEKIIEQHK